MKVLVNRGPRPSREQRRDQFSVAQQRGKKRERKGDILEWRQINRIALWRNG
jgi:hypothetical protein